MSLSSLRSWSMWASWQRSPEMFSARKFWRGVLWERWSSGLTSSPPSMFWDITSRSPCLSRSCRGELLFAAEATDCWSVWLVTGTWAGDEAHVDHISHSSNQLSCHHSPKLLLYLVWLEKKQIRALLRVEADSAAADNQNKPLSELVLTEASRWHFSSRLATLHWCIQPGKHVCFEKRKFIDWQGRGNKATVWFLEPEACPS